jgi:septal ring factor EnvC (AmiA/AmiB activator)
LDHSSHAYIEPLLLLLLLFLGQVLQQKCNELLLLTRQLQDTQQQLEDSQQAVAAADQTLQELRSQVKHLQQQLVAPQQQQAPAEASTPASCKPQVSQCTGSCTDTSGILEWSQNTACSCLAGLVV